MCVHHVHNRAELYSLTRVGVCLVDFNAGWCASCRLQEPIINHLARELKGRVSVVTADVDQNCEIAQACNIRLIPTLVVYRNGREITRFIGLQSEGVLSSTLQGLL